MEHDAFHVSYLSDKIPEAVFHGQTVKTVAYLRVSTAQQELRSPRLAIIEYAHKHDFRIDDFIEATASGQASEKRRRLDELMLPSRSPFPRAYPDCELASAQLPRTHRRRVCRLAGLERVGPAAVGFDDLVDLGHGVDGLTEGDDDLLVVADILVRERAALAVLEPLVADLVAADLEVPDLLWHALETRWCRASSRGDARGRCSYRRRAKRCRPTSRRGRLRGSWGLCRW